MDGVMIGALAVFGATSLALARRAWRKRVGFRQAVAEAASALGLTARRGGVLGLPSARGEVDGFHVALGASRRRRSRVAPTGRRRRHARSDEARVLVTEIAVEARLPRSLVIRPRPPESRGVLGALVESLTGRRGLVTGDEGFDAAIEVDAAGGELDALSRLGEESRARLGALLVDAGVRVEGRRLRWSWVGLAQEGDELTARTRELVALASALDRHGRSAAEAGAEIVLSDPLPAVRRRLLGALCEAAPQHPETARALSGALDDEDPELQVMAAERLGAEGFEAARAVALDEGAPTALRVRTAHLLAGHYPERRQAALETLDLLLGAAPDEVMAAALAGGRALGHEPELCQLLAAAERAGADSGGAIARALGRQRGVAVERALIGMLRIGAPEVRVEVARALARVGSLQAIVPLRPLTTGLLAHRGVKSAAREAIETIEARLGGSASGRLSLAPAEGGELSLALDPATEEGERDP